VRDIIAIFTAAIIWCLSCALTGCGGGTGSPVPAPPVVEYPAGWHQLAEHEPFLGRDGAGFVVLNDTLYMLGGWNPGQFPFAPTTNEVWSSTDGATWIQVHADTRADWEPRHMAGWVAFKGQLWIVGGDANSGHYQSDVWSSPDGTTWTKITNAAPWGPRVLHYTVVYDGRIYVMGGQTMREMIPGATSPDIFYSDVWSSSDGVTWEKLTSDAPWGPRGIICGSVVFNDRMWVIGGGTYWSADPDRAGAGSNQVWSSVDGVNWKLESTAPWSPRRYHNALVHDGKLYVIAGIENDDIGEHPTNDVWSSVDGVTWTQEPDAPWQARHAASAVEFNGTIIFGLGTDHASLNDIWSYR